MSTDLSSRVDAHHHLWDLAVRDQPWITGEAMAPLRRRFDVAELAAATAAGGFAHTVVAFYVTTGFVVVGVAAHFLLRRRFVEEGRAMLSATLWLLTFLAGEIRGRRSWVVGFVVAWLLIMGPPPLTGATEFIVAFLGQLVGLAVCGWALLGARSASSDAPVPALSVG